MGYRSIVGFALTDDALAAFKDRLASTPEVLAAFESDWDSITKKDGWILFQGDEIKWHSHFYAEVAAVEDFMNLLDEKEKSDQYAFVRIGEDFDDVEIRSNYCDPFDLGYTRTLCVTP